MAAGCSTAGWVHMHLLSYPWPWGVCLSLSTPHVAHVHGVHGTANALSMHVEGTLHAHARAAIFFVQQGVALTVNVERIAKESSVVKCEAPKCGTQFGIY